MTTRLADYRPFPFQITRSSLTFRLDPSATRVIARLSLTPLTQSPLHLDGEGLKLIRIEIDGAAHTAYTLTDTGLTLTDLPATPFTLETEVEINPRANTALEGLYMSNGMYCTQCEAEGFRKITFYPDRPDVMAPFDVRIESAEPVLLSNGNPVARGATWAEWHDPHPKPAYLFALVAGDLRAVSGQFTTMDGRDVTLNIYVRAGDEGRCDFALEAVKRSMAWDEQVWGRAYDLDLFNIVAVDDFNMGAMENKGLNIFNSKWVLASPQTATDADYERIEGIIAHEYFHNWTGNRITCRDWFQLCLKEGLTVYRDQQFTRDLRAGAVKRIEDVLQLRARQFREDQGPLAHPVRPEEYEEINNFYTATIYEKGAEIIGMLRTLIGEAAWAAGTALYFARHDGQACTIEDWLKVFEEVSGRDLSQFALWYRSAGTPRVTLRERFEGGVLSLTLRQDTPPTPNQPDKPARLIPLRLCLFDASGAALGAEQVIELSKPEQVFEIKGLAARPVVSINRGFSAPVMLEAPDHSPFLLAHDTDPFNRWEAGRRMARAAILGQVAGESAPVARYLDALEPILSADLEPAYRALMLRLPAEDEIAGALYEAGQTPNPDAIHAARGQVLDLMAARFAAPLKALAEQPIPQPYRPDPAPAGLRAQRLAALSLIARQDCAPAEALFARADNMTDSAGALAILLAQGKGEAERAAFYARWQGDRLVMDKWFMLSASLTPPAHAAARAEELAAHPLFDWKNPNRFRALMAGFGANHAGFHAATGAGYRFYAGWLKRLDPVNPQTAARMSTAFETWSRYDAARQAQARAALESLREGAPISRDLGEMVARMLG